MCKSFSLSLSVPYEAFRSQCIGKVTECLTLLQKKRVTFSQIFILPAVCRRLTMHHAGHGLNYFIKESSAGFRPPLQTGMGQSLAFARVYTEVLHFHLHPSTHLLSVDRFTFSPSHFQRFRENRHLLRPFHHQPRRTHVSDVRTRVSS